MKQKYHHYTEWEDYQNGMWRKETPKNEKDFLDKAIDFTGDHELYGSWMMRVVKEWPNACEQNLTNTNINRRAWVGHAACCLAFGCPEYITREAWGFLTDQQRDDANKQADYAIMTWEENYYGGKNECFMF